MNTTLFLFFSPLEDEEEPATTSSVSATKSERLMGVGRNSTVVTTRFEEVRAGEELIPPLPAALERHIRVVKDSDTLGVQVDIEEEGINGLVVRYVSRKLNNMIQHNIWGFIKCPYHVRPEKLFGGYFDHLPVPR